MKYITVTFSLLFLFLFSNDLQAQWVQTNGPYGGLIQCLAVNDTDLFAGDYFNGVFFSTNSGANWTAVNNGLTDNTITALAINGKNIFAGTDSGVFLSTNNGSSWTAINNGLTSKGIGALAVNDTDIFAGTGGGVFLSTNNGSSWTAVNNGLTNRSIGSFAINGKYIFAGTYYTVARSTNNGTNWVELKNGLTPNSYYQALTISGTNIFAGSEQAGIFLSTNNGGIWTSINNGLKSPYVWTLSMSDTNIFAGNLGGGVFLSTDNGLFWNDVNNGLTNYNIYSLAIIGANIFAGTYLGGVWRRPISEMITSVKEVSEKELPSGYSLEQNFPNPLNPTTTIEFSLPKATHVSLSIYNSIGQEVSKLISKDMNAGIYTTEWNASGFASGVYYYRIVAGSFVETKKLILLK